MPIIIPLILKWLVSNWKLILIGAFVAWIGWLRWDNGHLKKEVQDLDLKISTLKAESKTLADNSAAITRKYDHTLADKHAVENKLAASETKRIKDEKKLDSIVVPNVAVSVFNGTDNASGTKATTETKPGDVSGAVGPSPIITPTNPDAPSNKTLADILVGSNENRNRLNMCVDTVHEWQHFWTDFSNAVTASGN